MTTEPKKKRKRNNKRKITFDEELISKEEAQNILLNDAKERIDENHAKPAKKKENKKRKKESNRSPNDSKISDAEPISPSPKKVKKRNILKTEDVPIETVEELDPAKPEIKTTASKRELKRKKHQKFLEKKKLKSELNMQKLCLNYLSMWKHSRATWKFVKLRQIWIQKSMFDDARIPEDFWQTALEYFNNSKGKSKDTLLADALKIVENIETIKEDLSEEQESKYNRAREIVQFLQE